MSQQVLFDSAQVTVRRSVSKMFGEIYHKRMGDGIHEHSANPHRKLWLTVIATAVIDCLTGLGQDRVKPIWFYTAECRFICDLAGVEQDALCRRVRELLIGQ